MPLWLYQEKSQISPSVDRRKKDQKTRHAGKHPNFSTMPPFPPFSRIWCHASKYVKVSTDGEGYHSTEIMFMRRGHPFLDYTSAIVLTTWVCIAEPCMHAPDIPGIWSSLCFSFLYHKSRPHGVPSPLPNLGIYLSLLEHETAAGALCLLLVLLSRLKPKVGVVVDK